MQRIILASNSPRRKMLLEQIELPFTAIASNIDEKNRDNLPPAELVKKLSREKAQAILQKNSDAIIIGADTIVVYNNSIIGKPLSPQRAKEMLQELNGNMHEVLTGVTVATNQKILTKYEQTKVWMKKLSEKEIDSYINTGEPLDKAGAYGIQEKGAVLIEKVEGEYTNVVGLPLPLLFTLLQEVGITITDYWNNKKN